MERVKENLFSQTEVTVLKCLCNRQQSQEDTDTTDITELSSSTGIRDNEEVLRALYTLEGKSLVEPHPPGDFTSTSWRITGTGVKALTLLKRE